MNNPSTPAYNVYNMYRYDDSDDDGVSERYDDEGQTGTIGGVPYAGAGQPDASVAAGTNHHTGSQFHVSRGVWDSDVVSLPMRRRDSTNSSKRERSLSTPYATTQWSTSCLVTTIMGFLVCFLCGIIAGAFVYYQSSNLDKGSPWLSPIEKSIPATDVVVGAYYYPWYKDDFHRGDGYVRDTLQPPQQPSLGEYDDSDPAVVEKHLVWSRQARISLWVCSWWGSGRREDDTIKDVILTHPKLGDHKIALFYETTGRVQEKEGYSTQRIAPDIQHMCENYFDHPNYLKIDGRPVLYIYLTRKLESLGILDRVLDPMRKAAWACGHNLYIVGDHSFRGTPATEEVSPPMAQLDAITNYDVYGSIGAESEYAGKKAVVEHYEGQRDWKNSAAAIGCRFIPAVSPGYNDLGVRPARRNTPLSRQLTKDSEPGTLFSESLRHALPLVDGSTGGLLMVNSFNEFHEDTQIEPVSGVTTSLPESSTYGLPYHGYGEHYLNLLRDATEEYVATL